MAVLLYTSSAEQDLDDITTFTIRRWGIDQAIRYISELEDFSELLSNHPLIGRKCDEVATELRRMEHKSHVVFFFAVQGGIRVSRILHKSRDPFGEEFEDF
ncbi:MAG: type II toxin-antitoxin system RelE/ParE family toxin [Acidobacteriaceae bacterium]